MKKMIRYGVLWTSTAENKAYPIMTEFVSEPLHRQLNEAGWSGISTNTNPYWKVRVVRLIIETVKKPRKAMTKLGE